MKPNVCFQGERSCSACCGLFNLDTTDAEREAWLTQNTALFLELDLEAQSSVYKYRQNREKEIGVKVIIPDVYVCPFLGWLQGAARGVRVTGCLLHPASSPHPQIERLENPQSFSLYGQSICQEYDCIAKQSHPLDSPPLRGWAYSRWVANHNLQAICGRLSQEYPKLKEALYEVVFQRIGGAQIPVTSFEMPLVFDVYTLDQLWGVLGALLIRNGYEGEAFEPSPEALQVGEEIRRELIGRG